MINLQDNNLLIIGSAVIIGVIITKLFCNKSTKKASGPTTLIDRNTKISLKLTKKTIISHDTRIFRFALPSEEHILGLPVGQHISLSAKIDGKLTIRSYTPVSSDNDMGFVELIVKVYYPNVHPKFPEGGKMTMHLEKLKVGQDSIDFVGPKGFIKYESTGKMAIIPDKKIDSPPTRKYIRKIGMIAGGSGITPMLQIIRQIMSVEEDNTEIFLLYANQTEEDILCRSEIEQIVRSNPKQFHVHYTLDRPPTDGSWKYSSGFINQEMLELTMPPYGMPTPGTSPQILICGPPPMVKFACLPNLEKMGWIEEDIYCY